MKMVDQEPHFCIAKDKRTYQNLAERDSDAGLLAKINGWGEFSAPLTENTRVWRLFCGIHRREACKRGLGVGDAYS